MLSKQATEKLEAYLTSSKSIPISILNSENPFNLPVIYIGQAYQRVLLFPNDVNAELLEKIFRKALLDNNHRATIELMRYISHNEIMFWDYHKSTELGAMVMAAVLGSHA